MARPLNILCVDDDRAILAIIELSLGLDKDIKTRTARDGHQALALLTQSWWAPDGILLDVKMPGLDGKQLLDEIRAIPRFKTTPVIFLTASVGQREVANFVGLGVKGVIAKPFDPTALAAKVRELLD